MRASPDVRQTGVSERVARDAAAATATSDRIGTSSPDFFMTFVTNWGRRLPRARQRASNALEASELRM